MKKNGVCKGCKHRVTKSWCAAAFNNTCNYLENTGKSRLVIERENGGYKTDSCICYEAGPRMRRRKKRKEVKRGQPE